MNWKKAGIAAGVSAGVFLGMKYVFPVIFSAISITIVQTEKISMSIINKRLNCSLLSCLIIKLRYGLIIYNTE